MVFLLALLSSILVSSSTSWPSYGKALAQCLPDQSSSLLELKRGFSFSELGSWRTGTDCCTWDGVTCDFASGMVTGLDLGDRNISGKVGPSLFKLTSLERLNVAFNFFDGSPIPQPGFERLANLTHLNLSNAYFVGQVPIGIARLKKLVSLDLSNLFWKGELTLDNPNLRELIRNLSNLEELYLDGVNMSANGMDWSKAVSDSVPRIRRLSLWGCSLSGPIDASLARLRSLSILRLSGNNLSSIEPDFFGNFSSLTELYLGSCQLRGSFPDSIFRIPRLIILDVSSNPMFSGSLPEFPVHSALESLVLSDTNLSGTLPESIGNLKYLTNLQLTSCSFVGEIPSSIGNLTELVHLDLSVNGFSGNIPSIMSWTNISEIVLSHNHLTGRIPLSYGNVVLHNLTKLDLRNNSLNGSIPTSLFTLPRLQVLGLSQNQLSGQLAHLSNVSSSLVTIDLSNNKLQGQIPRSVLELSGLVLLSLASNSFSGTIKLDSLGNLRSLTYLDLSNNKLSILDGGANSSLSLPSIITLKLAYCNLNKIPGFLRYCDSMAELDLSNNRIDGVIPEWIWSIGDFSLDYVNLSYNLFIGMERPNFSMNPITVLDLHSNKIQGPIPLPPPYTLVLDYSNNNFSSSIPSNITMDNTIFFSLSNNSLTGEIPGTICNARFLQVLDLSYNTLNGLIPRCLFEGDNDLKVLNLRGNQFRGSLPQDFSKACELQTINLNGNKLGGEVPRSLASCKMLEVLDLGNNEIHDSFPYWLGNIAALRVLVLRSNKFYGQLGPPPGTHESNNTFPMLQIFDLSSNQFSGNLPSECFGHLKVMMMGSELPHRPIGFQYLELDDQSYYQDTISVTIKGREMTLVKILTILTYVDFSNNRFAGGIPEVIGGLKSLCMLNLSNNALTGGIPPVLGSLRQLESLDLSRNHLSGDIPPELTSLTFLSYLNLSYNDLSGRVPQGRQFDTFSNSSFEGNDGLCGSPLSKPCTESSAEPILESKHASSKLKMDVIWQWMFVGLGFGIGFAVLIALQTVCGNRRRWHWRSSSR